MEYKAKELEAKWQQYWRDHSTYRTTEDHSRPKYYVLDMFPYPSGAGLHVGHPLGYIASDIFARYKRLEGFNVLHPMGYDAYGLPAEQYAIQTGQHPAITTEKNLAKYREQLDRIGFSFDWEREIKTSDPTYYKWTQWAFIQMYKHYFSLSENKVKPIEALEKHFQANGTEGVDAIGTEDLNFSAEEWSNYSEEQQQEALMNYRMAYLAGIKVNWCPELGTVLANDEIVDGLSVRGGHPVVQKTMKQWCLRVSAYAQRLLDGLDHLDWSDSIKEIQRNWIGRSKGTEVKFSLIGEKEQDITVFTTRPDTIYGASFLVLAPEYKDIETFVTPEQQKDVQEYLKYVASRSERERQADTKTVTGVFSGSYANNPITNEQIPIWISEYVLAGYGTGSIMAVPAHDSRDFLFAKKFKLPITQVVIPSGEETSDVEQWTEAKDSKQGTLVNSPLIDGLTVEKAIESINAHIEENKLGVVKTNYRLRDAIFSRQRYWGEPFPIQYKGNTPYPISEDELPLNLPEVDNYLPTAEGKPPLSHVKNWVSKKGHPLEVNTMPGFAGSSAYFLRYMDPHNNERLVSEEANKYWEQVDLYIGGREHATGHLIYSRFWNMFLYDIGHVVKEEPFKKLLNQGMIQGRSNFVYRVKGTNTYVSHGLKDQYDYTPIHVDVSIVNNDILDIEKFKVWQPAYKDAEFILENGQYICGWAVEKMSKTMYNVVNPDDIIENYGADTLRLYEMFLGPIEQAKPWDTKGIDGVHRFIKRVWSLFYTRDHQIDLSDDQPSEEELRILHKTIKKVGEDISNFSFNTAISAFMICTNELIALKCNKRHVLEPFMVILSPFAPHLAEELWQNALSQSGSVCYAEWPKYEEKYLQESTKEYPISINGKVRCKLTLPADMSKEEIESAALAHDTTKKWIEGKQIRKIIVVPGKIVNIVIA